MIKYPNDNANNKKKVSQLKYTVNVCAVRVGQRFFVENNPVTCVHIDGNKYIFSMDDIFKSGSYDEIEVVLKTIYTTGMIDGINVLSTDLISDIDFLFVPTEYQVFGERCGVEKEKEEEQFEWFKRGEATRVKGLYGGGESCSWRLHSSNHHIDHNYGFVVNYYGGITNCSLNTDFGIPVFFQITKDN